MRRIPQLRDCLRCRLSYLEKTKNAQDTSRANQGTPSRSAPELLPNLEAALPLLLSLERYERRAQSRRRRAMSILNSLG